MNITECQAIAWYAIQECWADQYFTNAEVCDATGLSLGTIQRFTRTWVQEGLLESFENHPYLLFKVFQGTLDQESQTIVNQMDNLISILKKRGFKFEPQAAA